MSALCFFFFQAEDGIRDLTVTGVQTCALPILYRATWGDQVVVEIPGRRLIDDCRVYHPEAREDPAIAQLRSGSPHPASRIPPPAEALLTLLDHPPIASKRWVYEQYDSTVQASTVHGPGGDAGVIRVREAEFGLAVTVDGNSRYVRHDLPAGRDPRRAGRVAVVGSRIRLCGGHAPARGPGTGAAPHRLRRGGSGTGPVSLGPRLLAGWPWRRARGSRDGRGVRGDRLRLGRRPYGLRLGPCG